MPALVRTVSIRGPRFFEDGGKLMFVNHFDASTRDGPREATVADKREHPEALAEFKAGGGPDPMGPLVSFRDPRG